MAYIGPEPNPGQNREVDDISSSFNGSTTAFTLQVNSQNVSPGSSNAIIVSLGGVVQNPGTDYTVAASTLTFTTAPASGLSFFGLVLGQSIDTEGTSDGSIVNASVSGSAAIAGTKISPDFGSQTVITDGVSLVGLSSTLSTNTAKLQVAHTDGNADVIVHRAGNNSNPPSLNFQKTRNASIGNYGTIVQSGDELGSIRWGGADGSGIAHAARIVSAVDGTPGSNDMPGRLQFHTSADGSEGLTERMRIDSSGNVNIGVNTSANPMTYLRFGASQYGAADIRPTDEGSHRVGLSFYTDGTADTTINPTERMRIHDTGEVQVVSEKLTIGTSVTNGGVSDGMLVLEFNGSTKNGIKSRANPGASESQHLVFVQNSSEVGRIHTNNSSTSYATSSDYRLKENVTAISDGITRLKTLKPSRFNFIIDPDKTVDGFLAHEVTGVPEAISGTKDGVDENGDPDYQTIDQSKLVPLLTAALQEAIAKIEVLETKVAALEAA